MSLERWGTFSVKDHCRRRPFISEVLLYDRLVIPYPPDETERLRWAGEGWDPERLDHVLKILDERWDKDQPWAVNEPPTGLVRAVPWDHGHQELWTNRRTEAAKAASEQTAQGLEYRERTGYEDTATVLAYGLPRYVTGVVAVADYSSFEDAQADLGLTSTDRNVDPTLTFRPEPLPGSAVCSVIGREFLVPNDEAMGDDDLLKAAVGIAHDKDFRRTRASFHNWQDRFISQGLTDQESLDRAVMEMRGLLEEEHAAVRNTGIRTGISTACLIGAVSIGVLGPFGVPVAAAVAAGGAFLSVGQFVVDHWPSGAHRGEPEIYAMFRDAQRRLGWKAAERR